MPVNKSAHAARVTATALDPAQRLTVTYVDRKVALSRVELERMRQTTVRLPIACVEGWSANATWTGVRVRELLTAMEAPIGSDVRVVSLQQAGPYRETVLAASFADDPLTLLALTLNGHALSIDHGYPCRLIAPTGPECCRPSGSTVSR